METICCHKHLGNLSVSSRKKNQGPQAEVWHREGLWAKWWETCDPIKGANLRLCLSRWPERAEGSPDLWRTRRQRLHSADDVNRSLVPRHLLLLQPMQRMTTSAVGTVITRKGCLSVSVWGAPARLSCSRSWKVDIHTTETRSRRWNVGWGILLDSKPCKCQIAEKNPTQVLGNVFSLSWS